MPRWQGSRKVLTDADRARIYACMNSCEFCGANRGEYCRGKNGRLWTKGWHMHRGPGSGKIPPGSAYHRLKKQVLAEEC